MKLSKTLVIPVAGLLVVLGAGAVLASTASAPAPAGGAAVQPAAESASPGTSPKASTQPKRVVRDDTLTTVLDGLVAKGTITAAQKQAILDGLQAERDKKLAEAKARAEAARKQAEQLRGFLEDGQITQQELNQLPADSPVRKLTDLMDDGKITTDELRSIGRGWFGGFGRGNGFGRGHGFGHDGAKPNASPSASPATSS